MVRPGTPPRNSPAEYEIRLGARLDPRWSDWFDGFRITPLQDGHTLLTGPVPDQATLHGLLAKIRDLGLPLVSFTLIGDGNQNDP
jgi:hypothetical protein